MSIVGKKINLEVLRNTDSMSVKEKFDLIIDLHNNIRSFFLRKLLGVKSLVYNKNRLKRWLIVNLKLKVKIPHIVDSYIKTFDGQAATTEDFVDAICQGACLNGELLGFDQDQFYLKYLTIL